MEVAISMVLVNIFSTIACGVICWCLGKRHGWADGIGDAAAEYAKGYNYGVLETIKKLSEEDEE